MIKVVETNLEKIKETAIACLYIQPEFNETFPFLVLHPFIGNNPYPVPNGKGSYDFLDITKEENLNTLIDKLRQVILDTPTVHKLFLLITQSHRRTFFQYINSYLSQEDYGILLREIWIHTEGQSYDVNVTLNTMLQWFKKADKQYLMNEQEREILGEMSGEITIYRGSNEDEYYDALSWTTNIDIARKFSRRFNDDGTVFSAKINKADILAYFDAEEEVVVNYKKLKDIEIIEHLHILLLNQT